MQILNEIKDAILAAQDILLITHVNPDGDAIGSTLALHTALGKMEKRSVCVCDGRIVEKYYYMNKAGILYRPEEQQKRFDLAIAIDCADQNRMGEADKLFLDAGKSINIDHHNTNEGFGHINLIKNVSSSGEIVYELIEVLGCGMDAVTAECLYTAISADTGNFTYSNTTENALLYTAKLIGYFDFSQTANLLYRTRSFDNTRLIAKAIDKLTLHAEDRIALMVITQADLLDVGIKMPDYEMLVNYASEVDTVNIAIFMRELKDSGYKISLRSSGDIDVAELAFSYGGGGHKNAAGCTINASFEEAKAIILAAASALL
jgi:phosphoesterase RecJ-like protein